MHDARVAGAAPVFLVAHDILRGGQQRPAALIVQPYVAAAMHRVGFKRHPGFGDAASFGRVAVDPPVARVDMGQGGGGHVGDGIAPLHGFDVPGEGHQIAPIAVFGEQVFQRLRVGGC